jgi:hypothetical protein
MLLYIIRAYKILSSLLPVQHHFNSDYEQPSQVEALAKYVFKSSKQDGNYLEALPMPQIPGSSFF